MISLSGEWKAYKNTSLHKKENPYLPGGLYRFLWLQGEGAQGAQHSALIRAWEQHHILLSPWVASGADWECRDYHSELCNCVRGRRGNWRHTANIFKAFMLTLLEETAMWISCMSLHDTKNKKTLRGNFSKLSGDMIKLSFSGCTGTERVSSNQPSSNNQMCWTRASYCKHNYFVIR